MAQPLGRTFHGCLTCRKRKVRCKGGGDPCQNCSRMNIDCHTSFDENLRISFSGSSAVSKGDRNRTKSRGRFRSTKPATSKVHDNIHQSTEFYPNCVGDGAQPEPNLNTTHTAPFSSPQPTALLPQILPSNDADGRFSDDYSIYGEHSDYAFFDVNGAWSLDFGVGGFGDIWNFELGDSGVTPDESASDHVSHSRPSNTMDEISSTAITVRDRDDRTFARDDAPANRWNPSDPERLRQIPLVNRDDDFYLAHYERCIESSPYSLKDDGKGNYLRFMLDFVRSTECDYDSPFRLSLLAWAAKHFQVAVHPDDTSWTRYYQRAMESRAALTAHHSPCAMSNSSGTPIMSSHVEVMICSTLILCRCDTLNDNVTSMHTHLDDLKSQLGDFLAGNSLSPFASQALLWLGYLHIRISLFSKPSINDGTGCTTLLDVIARHPNYEEICSRSHFYLSATMGGSYPQDERLQEIEKLPVSNRTHETFLLLASIIRFRSWRSLSGKMAAQNELEAAKAAAIELDIKRIEAEFALAAATNVSASVMSPGIMKLSDSYALEYAAGASRSTARVGNGENTNKLSDSKITRASLQWLACYAVFLSAKILWSRIRYPDIRSDQANQDTVSSILKIVLHMRRSLETKQASGLPWLKIPRTMAWPLPLFLAGIETTDAIHADWIRRFMDEVSSWEQNTVRSTSAEKSQNGGWIGNISGGKRVQALMAKIRAAQDARGRRVDIESIMDEMSNGGGAILI